MAAESILLYYQENELHKLKIFEISDDCIGDLMNGESGYHICHVKMITDLLLREFLRESGSKISLSEEDICAISMASSLHDIGKLQVPQSILNKPDTLSPLEYDIAKKHAVFGERMILDARADGVSRKVIDYAAQIAKNHHERIDGTGYHDGLTGDEIPLCAQVVAIAEAYDALTSCRNYKESYSQNDALQMIASGMCGLFDETLVQCLMRVVKHRSLAAFRERQIKAGRVPVEHAGINLKNVLLIGNTEYLTEAFVNKTFPKSKVLVVGNSELGSRDRLKLFRVWKPSVKSILETYEFDLIVFFSAGLRYHSNNQSDAEELRELLQYSTQLQKQVKILYLSPLDAAFEDETDKAILSNANEKLCEFYAVNFSLNIKTIRIPYLYSGTYKKDFLYSVFEEMHAGKPIQLLEAASAIMHFLSLGDLSELIIRILDNWTDEGGILQAGDEFHISFSDFTDKLRALDQKSKVEFNEAKSSGLLKTANTSVRSEYGWFAKVSILEDLPDQYALYLAGKQQQKMKMSLADRLRGWISGHSLFVKIAELILLFVLFELLIYVTDSAVIFSVVDFRTIYVVIMATLYGLSFGMISAALSSLSYFVARVMAGTDPLTIFYEPTNWLAFVFFFLVGGLCGYVNLKKEDTGKYLREQNKMLESKLIFTGEIYEDTLREKKELKKQIISSKDSFGKIFDITRRLNTVAPQQLYLRIIETFEEILENKSIAVYSVKPGMPFGRLEVSSRELLDAAARSISMDAYAPVIEKISGGEIWKNTELDSTYPMYAAGVYREEELVLVIFLWHANVDQRSLYYVNLFKIMRDLVQMSLLHAYDYHAALLDRQYIEHTQIMKAEFFEERIQHFAALAEKKISTYIILEFDLNGHTLEEAAAMISKKIRTTDILGIGSNGKLQLLLSQAEEKDLEYILPRFEELDIITTYRK